MFVKKIVSLEEICLINTVIIMIIIIIQMFQLNNFVFDDLLRILFRLIQGHAITLFSFLLSETKRGTKKIKGKACIFN